LEKIYVGTGAVVTDLFRFHTHAAEVLESTDVSELYDNAVDTLL
jgi:hypothetical protein